MVLIKYFLGKVLVAKAKAKPSMDDSTDQSQPPAVAQYLVLQRQHQELREQMARLSAGMKQLQPAVEKHLAQLQRTSLAVQTDTGKLRLRRVKRVNRPSVSKAHLLKCIGTFAVGTQLVSTNEQARQLACEFTEYVFAQLPAHLSWSLSVVPCRPSSSSSAAGLGSSSSLQEAASSMDFCAMVQEMNLSNLCVTDK